jgi:2-C-methyl-D-erythritol 4-phosphate cytidylyltransferase
MRVAALILAAGSSQRFGGRPKQFEELGGTTVLQRAVRAFVDIEGIDDVWVVTSQEHHAHTTDLLVDDAIAGVICGGDSRAESTQLGLAALGSDVSHVIIHDAARPLVPRDVVAACVRALGEADVVATVVEPTDSVVIVDGDRVVSTPARSSVRMHQTPQAFRCSVLTAAWERLADEETEAPTDDVTAVLRAFPDQPVAWVTGHRHSAKITEPDDLVVLRAWLEDDE